MLPTHVLYLPLLIALTHLFDVELLTPSRFNVCSIKPPGIFGRPLSLPPTHDFQTL